jgi:hypothetical protein
LFCEFACLEGNCTAISEGDGFCNYIHKVYNLFFIYSKFGAKLQKIIEIYTIYINKIFVVFFGGLIVFKWGVWR